ncbi:MAG TPA: ribose-5-phosphate isomerase RpiA [Solirubrobacteraceae bacterium]|nr:ribose-5-phosphate isomerase RpiA [Solirubrobacteraceae bacterium]
MTDPKDAARRAAAAAALERIEAGMTIGLGSGRAVWKLLETICERWPEGVPLRVVPASSRTEQLARQAGIELLDLDDAGPLDLAIDGADELDGRLRLIKGGGGALLREKLVVAAARRFVVVAETDKLVDRIGEHWRVPVEVVRFGWRTTLARLLDGVVTAADVRCTDDGTPFITDEGHVIVDCAVPREGDLGEFAIGLKAVVGVVEHGLFLGMADEALLGAPDGTLETIPS